MLNFHAEGEMVDCLCHYLLSPNTRAMRSGERSFARSVYAFFLRSSRFSDAYQERGISEFVSRRHRLHGKNKAFFVHDLIKHIVYWATDDHMPAHLTVPRVTPRTVVKASREQESKRCIGDRDDAVKTSSYFVDFLQGATLTSLGCGPCFTSPSSSKRTPAVKSSESRRGGFKPETEHVMKNAVGRKRTGRGGRG